MNADELAAVAAAAGLLFSDPDGRDERPAVSRWSLAARVRALDAGRARHLAAARSRWSAGGRLR